MSHMIKILTKQLQLLEIELGDYIIAKNQKLPTLQSTQYYANLLQIHQSLRIAITALENNLQEEIHVH
jgi:hypothetical protein